MSLLEYLIYKEDNNYYLKPNTAFMHTAVVLGINTNVLETEYYVFRHPEGNLKFVEKEVFLRQPEMEIKDEYIATKYFSYIGISKILHYLKTHKTVKANIELCYYDSASVQQITFSCLHKILPDIAF